MAMRNSARGGFRRMPKPRQTAERVQHDLNNLELFKRRRERMCEFV